MVKKSNETRKSRNSAIDAVRFFAALAVVWIHFGRNIGIYHGGFISTLTVLLNTLAILAVPLFFVFSGYYLYNENEISVIAKCKKSLRKLGISFILWEIIWLIFTSITTENVNPQDLISEIDIATIFRAIFLSSPLFGGFILWFLLALIVSTSIIFLDAIITRKYCGWIPLILGLIGYVLCLIFVPYANFFHLEKIDTWYFENSWFGQGLFFVALGYMLHKYPIKLNDTINKKDKIIITSVIIFLYLVEYANFKYCVNGENTNLYLTQIMLPFVIILIMRILVRKKDLLKQTRIPEWGANYSAFIYYAHYFIGYFILQKLSPEITQEPYVIILLPIVVFALSLFCGMFILRTKKLIKYHFNYLHNHQKGLD